MFWTQIAIAALLSAMCQWADFDMQGPPHWLSGETDPSMLAGWPGE
jgi:hypothetical protein